jgi:hypothetical protein
MRSPDLDLRKSDSGFIIGIIIRCSKSEQEDVVAAAAFSTIPMSCLDHSYRIIASKLHQPPVLLNSSLPF